MQETWGQSLCCEDALEKEMAPNSNTLTWEIPQTESGGLYSPWGCKSVKHALATKLLYIHVITFIWIQNKVKLQRDGR